MQPLPSPDVRAYYATALSALRFVEARRPTGRRFGPEADARWSGFAGELATVDRLDLLLRDADAEWPGAFGARSVFTELTAAEDDAFGLAWPGLDPVEAETVWHAAKDGSDFDAVVRAWSAAWGAKIENVEVGAITSVDRLVVVGPSALVAAVQAFADRTDLSWPDQVTVIATPPAHRQLATLSTAILNAGKPANVVAASRCAAPVGRLLASPDADPADRSAAAGGITS
jgi:hypothetical protein